MDTLDLSFHKSLVYLHKILGLKYTGIVKQKDDAPKVDILRIFKKVTKQHNQDYEEELKVYSENICNEFIQMPYINWVREGITPNTQNIFGIGYSRDSNRVVIPHRLWYGDINEYVGVIGRTLVEHYDMFDIPKYFPIRKFPKSMNVFALQENYEGIQKAGYVVVFESEKSPMKRHSKLDYTGVALGGHEMSQEQAKILINLDVDIIIAFDKDISLEHIRATCDMFYGIRPVYYIYDEYGLLGKKESPADKNEKIYKVLFNRKIKYERSDN